MAKKFLTGLTLVNLDSDPLTGSEGELYFNTSASVAKIYRSGAWSELGSGAGAGYTDEEAVDAVASALLNASANSNVVVSYDDANNTISLNTSGSIVNIDSIVYPDYITFDTTPETSSTTPGTLYWDSGDGLPKTILNANVELGIGQESVALVKNGTLSSIPKASVIYINGAQGQRPTIALADADTEPTSSKTFGFTAETIASGAEGFVVTEGILRGVNTNGLTEGGALWLSSTAGGYTQTMPPAPANSVFLGYVVKAHADAGEIFVKVQNGYELNELHNVSINGVSDNQALVYNSSASLWQNESLVNSISGTENEIEVSASVGNITIGLPNSPTLTTPNIGAATGTSLTTTGSVVSHITILNPTFTSNAYTLVLGDDGDLLMLDNGATDGTVYVPTDATYDFVVGTQINLVQKGAGQITIQATTPATTTINYTPGNKLRTQWSGATLIKTAANEWLLMGDLEL